MSTLMLAACLAFLASTSVADLEAVHLARDGVPQQPGEAVGGGEVFLELGVGADGMVQDVKTLRHTPPFTASLRRAVADWQFAPGNRGWRALVAGVFRPPSLFVPTVGEVPQDVAVACQEVPCPIQVVLPDYPVHALGDGVVVARLDVTREGRVETARVVRSAAGFDGAAVSAAREWRFRPARERGQSLPAVVFVVFGFREPATLPGAHRTP